jgi:phosphatidylserine/phosphatidylglycerophosphate/cardiolipin synthase-like enzyme
MLKFPRVYLWAISVSFVTLLWHNNIYADYFEPNATYQVYFTPTHRCTQEIVRAIQGAQHSLYVQAYFLTSEPIQTALLDAKGRQVDVKVILDKNHPEHSAGIKRMLQSNIPIWVDKRSGIAHNKIIIIDEKQVITGSFNFTYSAEHKNRENVLWIRDKNLARQYLDNWHRCQMHAMQETPVHPPKRKATAPKKPSVVGRVIETATHWLDVMLHALSIVLDSL